MKAVLRNALLFYVRSRVQRWFFALALLALVVRELLPRIPCHCHLDGGMFSIVSLPLLMGFAGASVMASAGMFRTISSLRTVYLIPRARAQLIIGLLLAQVLLAALVTAIVFTFAGSTTVAEPWGSTRGNFELVFGMATLAAVAAQIISAPSRIVSAVSGALLLVLLTTLLARIDVFLQPEIAGVSTADLLTVTALATWAGFAAWYLSFGPIAPVAAVWTRGGRHKAHRSSAASSTRTAAMETYLLGQASLWLACRQQFFLWIVYAAMVGGVFGGIIAFTGVPPRPPPDFSTVSLMLMLAIPAVSNQIAGRIARHSRKLWLRSDDSRMALFATAERLAWRALALVGIPFFLAATLAWNLLPHMPIQAAYPVAIYLTVTACSIYSGLLNFTRNTDIRFFVFAVAAQGAVVAAVWHSDKRLNPQVGVPLGYWAVPLGLALGAVALRWVTQRRWSKIDWLRLRAPQTAARLRNPLIGN